MASDKIYLVKHNTTVQVKQLLHKDIFKDPMLFKKEGKRKQMIY